MNRERELSMVDLSQSGGSRHHPDLTSHRRIPVDRDIDLERGEARRDRIASRNLHPTTRSSTEATRTRVAA